MKDYGTVTSSVEPQELEVNDIVVRVASDITEMETEIEGETVTQYQYHLVEYGKDEYIKLMSGVQVQNSSDVDSCMIALTEIYEMMEV